MVNLLATLGTAGDALAAYSQALQVVENNVVNASTPGYAKQTQTFDARLFNPVAGDAGGVEAGMVANSRNEYAEQAVRDQQSLLGEASQDVSSLTGLQTVFDVSGSSGIPYALNNLLQSFSAWAQSPGDTNARQSVIANADSLAGAFNDAARALNSAAQDATAQIQSTVTQVNHLVSQLQQYNVQEMAGDRNDPGLDAQIHSTLEQLSQYVSVTATNSNGSWTVLLNGQTPLLVGSRQYQLAASMEQPSDPAPVNSNAPPLAVIRAADGTDVTSRITTGQLGALLSFRNSVLPQYIGSGSQQGELNTMAQQLADHVNGLLTAGNVSDGPPPVTGTALFTYDTSDATGAARTLSVNPAITTAQLAAIDPGPPKISNGVALALAQLTSPQSSTDEIGGLSYSEYYGSMASNIGNLLSRATSEQQVQQSAVAQAQNLRQQASGVDLNEEAMTLTQLQRAYDAVSRMVGVLDQLTQDVLNMVST